MSAIRYREDIDGLRALAVLPIVIFHAGVSQLSGGFIGVDIFFVISGYLITSIILREMGEQRFSIAEFYHRRIVRIFPALYFLIAAVLTVGTAFMLPAELAGLGKSAAATVGFVSNIYYWRTADYFGPAAETQPLLHTWSLGVEEQFYIFYPLLLLAVFRYARERLRAVLVLLMLVSFAIGAIGSFRSPDASFYLLPTRGWELALGGLAAAGAYPRLAAGQKQFASAIGLLLIVAGYFAIRPEMAFPVPWALLPCVGTALLIAYGEGSFIGTALSTGVLRLVGRISYSLYLWHWPIIAFYRLTTGLPLSPLEAVGLIAASFVMAVLSYRFVEQPALRRFRSAPRGRVLAVGTGALLASMAGSMFLAVNVERLELQPARIRQIAAFEDYKASPYYQYQFRRGVCFRGDADSHLPMRPDVCMKLSDTKPNLVVLGDSHAAQYWRAFALRYPDRNVLQATASGCRPVIDNDGAPRCREIVDYVMGPMLKTGKVDLIVLAGRWKAEDLPHLGPTIRHIREAGTRVVLVGPSVEYEGSFPSMLARSEWQKFPSMNINELRAQEPVQMNGTMRKIAQEESVVYADVQEIVCPSGGECMLFAPNGAPLLFDSNHLTFPAARFVVEHMAKDVREDFESSLERSPV